MSADKLTTVCLKNTLHRHLSTFPHLSGPCAVSSGPVLSCYVPDVDSLSPHLPPSCCCTTRAAFHPLSGPLFRHGHAPNITSLSLHLSLSCCRPMPRQLCAPQSPRLPPSCCCTTRAAFHPLSGPVPSWPCPQHRVIVTSPLPILLPSHASPTMCSIGSVFHPSIRRSA
jgi:hypothetical protein